jgi:LysR family nitrogen assimilation transcriptional regulator
MDLKRLRTFVAVAEHGTVSKAATVLNITQPALSRQIVALEHEFGFPLFERSGRRLTLTPRGEQLLGSCRSLLACAATLTERAQRLRDGDIKELKVTATALTIEALFPKFLHFYAERIPGVRMKMVEADPEDHLILLKHGTADLAVNVINNMQVDDARFGSFVLPPFHIVAACSRALKTGDFETIDIRELCKLPLLLLNSRADTNRLRRLVPDRRGPAECLHRKRSATGAVATRGSRPRRCRRPLNPAARLRKSPCLQGDLSRGSLKLAVLWDRLRVLPRHAQEFSGILAEHIRAQFPPERRADRLAIVR